MSEPFRQQEHRRSHGIAPGRLVITAQAGIQISQSREDARFPRACLDRQIFGPFGSGKRMLRKTAKRNGD
jgi:hypothetical protein